MTPEFINPGLGMTLIHTRTEKFKSGLLTVSFVHPMEREKTYLTSLLLSVLLRGTRSFPTVSALNKRLDYLYGTTLSVNNYILGDSAVTGFTAELLDERYVPSESEEVLSAVAELMREIFFHPVLDEDGLLSANYVESEKKLQCENIRARKDSPRRYAKDRCRELMYAGEPCGIPLWGTEEQVAAVTPRMLTDHWHALLASFSPDFFYLGSVSAERVKKSLCTAFSPSLDAYREESTDTVRYQSRIIRHAGKEKRAEEKTPFSQGQLVIGMRTGISLTDSDVFDCYVLNELLGVSPMSKLFVNVREKRSLCYSVYSWLNLFKGTLFVSCGLKNENRQTAEDEIFRQIDAIRTGGFTEDEFLAAKKSLFNTFRLVEDSPAGMEGFYYGHSLVGIKDPPEAFSAGVAAVTREGVIRAAKMLSVDTVFFLRGTGTAGNGEEDDND